MSFLKITEGITFGTFNSMAQGWSLMSREAPSPEEKEVVEDLLYSQGVLDFSMLTGERYFQNRIITYEFKLVNTSYQNRKQAERKIKSSLMRIGQSNLTDTHDEGFYWYGKFRSVRVKDDPLKRHLLATLEFDCYPFLIANDDYFDDVWDTFSFEYGVANWTKWNINQKQVIPVYNSGDATVIPTIITSASMMVTFDGEDYRFDKGESENVRLRIAPRQLTHFTVTGTGEISIRFAREVLG